MENDKFEDIAILKTLAELSRQGMLHEDDQHALESQLKTDWGRQAANNLLTDEDEPASAATRSVLRHFSDAV
jgi:hypothetical protein